jgi:hypothetical protein
MFALNLKAVSARWLFVPIVVLTFLAYYPTLRVGFIWDDQYVIEKNPRIRTWAWTDLRSDFRAGLFHNPKGDLYRPLQTVLNRVDHSLWGLHPVGFHLTNLLLQALNGCLVLMLGLALGLSPLAALFAGCLFTVHPIIVQDLIVVVGRDELLSLAFMLTSLLLLMGPGLGRAVAGIASFGLALLSKESAIVFPALYLLVIRLSQKEALYWQRTGALLLVAAAYLMLYVAVMPSPASGIDARLPLFLITDFPAVLGRYVGLVAVPWPLYTDRAIPFFSVCEKILWFLVFGTLVVWSVRRQKGWPLATAATVVLLFLPKTLKMVSGGLMLDHWMYPALPALMLAAGYGLQASTHHRNPSVRRGGWGLFGLLLAGWMVSAHANVALRGTQESFFRWSLRFPTSLTMKQGLGATLLEKGDPESVAIFQAIRDRFPHDEAAAIQLAVARARFGNQKLARAEIEQFVQEHPEAKQASHVLEKIK